LTDFTQPKSLMSEETSHCFLEPSGGKRCAPAGSAGRCGWKPRF